LLMSPNVSLRQCHRGAVATAGTGHDFAIRVHLDQRSRRNLHPLVAVSVYDAPPVPANLAASVLSRCQINVTWLPSVNATEYLVSRDGIPVGTVAGTNFLDTGLSPNPTSFLIERKARRNRGGAKSGTRSSLCNCSFKVVGIWVMSGR
jgi:hypothetical protein